MTCNQNCFTRHELCYYSIFYTMMNSSNQSSESKFPTFHEDNENDTKFQDISNPPSVGVSGLWIFLVLDESGSMNSVKSNTIEAFNNYIKEQQTKTATENEKVSLLKFEGTNTKILYNKTKLSEVPLLSDNSYIPHGTTNLCDAVGKTIQLIDNALLEENSLMDRPAILVVILTDGKENSSIKFDKFAVSSMIKSRRDVGWQFLFFGANYNAAKLAEEIGIPKEAALQISVDESQNYSAAMSDYTDMFRSQTIDLQRQATMSIQSSANSEDGILQAAVLLSSLSNTAIDDKIRTKYESQKPE